MRWFFAFLVAGCGFSGNPLDPAVSDDAAPDGAIDAAPPDAADPPDPLADCTGLDVSATADQTLTDGGDLAAAVAAAGSGDVIELAAGSYSVAATMLVTVDDLTIRGADRLDASAVTIVATGSINVFDIQGSGFTIGNVTFEGGNRHIVVSGSSDSDQDGFFANNIISRDAAVGSIVVAGFTQLHVGVENHFSHDGAIICSQFSPDPASCDDDIGVVVRDSDRWRVSKNSFTDYDCSNTIALQVRDSLEPVVDRNFVRRYTHGIRIGSFTNGSPGACDSGGTDWSVLRGVVCNNDLFEPSTNAGNGLLFAQACETVAVHNTVYQQGALSAIRVAEANSLVFAANNLSNQSTSTTEGGVFDSGLLPTNQMDAGDAAFGNPAIGVLTPVPGSTRAGSSLMTISPLMGTLCSTDRQGRPRDLLMPSFVGAYED